MADPNASDWLTAIGTVGTLAATVILFGLDWSRRRKREHSAQAVLVSGWSDSVRANEEARNIHVANMSDEPVYNVNVFLQDESNTDDKNNIVRQQISGNKDLVNKRFLSVLPPRQQITLIIKRENPASSGPNTLPLVGLLFNDRNNTRWLRDWDGKVTPARREEYDHNFHRATKQPTELPPLYRKWIG
jgi:hypothetical protein